RSFEASGSRNRHLPSGPDLTMHSESQLLTPRNNKLLFENESPDLRTNPREFALLQVKRIPSPGNRVPGETDQPNQQGNHVSRGKQPEPRQYLAVLQHQRSNN